MQEKYVGVLLALSSGFLIGSSFIFTKLGLLDASRLHGSSGDHYKYLSSWKWWVGLAGSKLSSLIP